MSVSDAKLRRLEDEHAKLKKLLAEAMLGTAVLKNITSQKRVTPAARRAAVTAAREAHGISERRACSIIGAGRSAMRYRHRRGDSASIRVRLKALAAERRGSAGGV